MKYKNFYDIMDNEVKKPLIVQVAEKAITMGEYFNALKESGEVQMTGASFVKKLNFSHGADRFSKGAKRTKADESFAKYPVYFTTVEGADYSYEYLYKGMRSNILSADDDFISTLSNGAYKYYGLVEDEAVKYAKENQVKPIWEQIGITEEEYDFGKKAYENLDSNGVAIYLNNSIEVEGGFYIAKPGDELAKGTQFICLPPEEPWGDVYLFLGENQESLKIDWKGKSYLKNDINRIRESLQKVSIEEIEQRVKTMNPLFYSHKLEHIQLILQN